MTLNVPLDTVAIPEPANVDGLALPYVQLREAIDLTVDLSGKRR